MKSPSRAWLGGFATQALSQAVGTLLAALVVVLGGAAFGYFKNLSGGELVAIALTALGLIGGLGLASALWQTRA
jgi:hypothetical protein